jgi:hypothetical protein
MIERRRFLIMSASGVALGAAAVAVPSSAADAVSTSPGSALRFKSWSRLAGSTINARDAHGHSFPLTVQSVVENRSVGGGRGESFHVVLRARSRKLHDGIYHLKHRDIGGSAHLFLVGGGARTATLSVDTRTGRTGS